MIVYHTTKEGFMADILSNDIDQIIHDAFYERLGRHTSGSEVQSWKHSLTIMHAIIVDQEIPMNAGITIEYQIPLSSNRVDFIISGYNDERQKKVIIIELKQWETAEKTEKDAIVKTRFKKGLTEVTHPSYQALSYSSILMCFNQSIQEGNIELLPCAYLHNYAPDNIITDSFYQEYIDKAPLFLKPDANKLKDFIKHHIKYGDNKEILFEIERSQLRPAKELADSIDSMLKGNPEFMMINEQKVGLENALAIAHKCNNRKKQVLIIEGGPGTGKSVIAIRLLSILTNEGKVAKYVTKNAAPREVYTTTLKGTTRKKIIDNLFASSGQYYNPKENEYDVLIVDEAHRLNAKSGVYSHLGENQIMEIIKSAKVSIFFLDKNQRIHFKDIGTKENIEKWAKKLNATIAPPQQLKSQFRCNGSEGYIAWIDNTLQISNTANVLLSEKDYDFQIFSDPNELRKKIEEKNKINNKSRMVAGYCWNWDSRKDHTKCDVVIPEFKFGMQWNKKEKEPWIIGEHSIDQIGCIHTCQGLELHYIGVIIGEDLRYENGKIITDISKRSKGDKSIAGMKKLAKENKAEALRIGEQIIKNTYRTLMTRGSKGCYVYFCDKGLENYFRDKIIPSLEMPTMNAEPSLRIEPTVNDDVKFIDYLPLYSLSAACEVFGDFQYAKEDGWVKVEGCGRLNRGMYVTKAAGKSMQPSIDDGDFCIFNANAPGSRNGKIVLVQHNNLYDPENKGSYSIKKYTSERKYDEETEEWGQERIVLKPLNDEYDPIIIKEEDGFKVIGEFVNTVK